MLGFPKSFSEFISTITSLHEALFENAEPVSAGKLRDSDVWFGIGRDQVCGAYPPEILDYLNELFDQFYPSQFVLCDRKQIAGWRARFVERFFMIHPFHDGNGRVARFMLYLGVKNSNRFRIDFGRNWRISGKEQRRYCKVLAYAHRHTNHALNKRLDHHHPRTNAFEHLERFLDRYIVELEPDWDLEAMPPEGGSEDNQS